MESRLRALFEAAANEKRVPGIAAIVLDVSGKVLFKGAFGRTNLSDENSAAMTTSTRGAVWSFTKLVVSVAALQLLEQGKIQLDDPVEKYVPEWKNMEVLEGFGDDGTPRLRAPKTTATILMLMTHTAGQTYDIFNKDRVKWRLHDGAENVSYHLPSTRAQHESPLTHDPGTRYEYGLCTDWLGFVIEAVTGEPLEDYVDRHILKPLGMKDSGAAFAEGDEVLYIHHRGADGSLTANPAMLPPRSDTLRGGGVYLISTVEDYSTFLLAILNGGRLPNSDVRILREETVKDYLFTDMMPQICSPEGIGHITVGHPAVTNEGTFLPDVDRGWSCGLMLNLDAHPKGRGLASGAWAALGNSYYWIDPAAGKLGMVMTEILPFMDGEVLHLFDALEREVYGHEAAKEIGEPGSNFSLP